MHREANSHYKCVNLPDNNYPMDNWIQCMSTGGHLNSLKNRRGKVATAKQIQNKTKSIVQAK